MSNARLSRRKYLLVSLHRMCMTDKDTSTATQGYS